MHIGKLAGAALVLCAAPMYAQPAGDDPRARALAERATERRAAQLADTALRDYRATARGFLTFLAQIGEGFPEPPRVVKADELAVNVYWKAPDLSKQVLVGRRDTLLLPADVGYYRDRYGIIQNNFPDRIRMGDGNDVRDVPHPLSEAGLREYRFTLGDSLTIRIPGRTIEVYEVRVRPVDDNQPRVVGTLYMDRTNADVARMALTFTRAAILDPRIDLLTVTLENGLVDGRFWLPRRQQLEVARTATWLDFPSRGIIRGRWEITEYEVNQGLADAFFIGPEIVSVPPGQLSAYPFPGRVLDSLPDDVIAATDDDAAAVRAEAESLVRERALERVRGATLSAASVSDFVRVNRVEGLALGAGTSWRFAPRRALALSARYGLEDQALKGRLSLSFASAGGRGVQIHLGRSYRDVGDVAERSLATNSIASQEFGSDYTDPYDVRLAGASVTLGTWRSARWSVDGSYEQQRPLTVNARPFNGEFAPTVPAWRVNGAVVALKADRPTGESVFGSRLRWAGKVRLGRFRRDDFANGAASNFGRVLMTADAERTVGNGELLLRSTFAGVAGAEIPPQQLAFAGGPVTGPGYGFHSFAGRLVATQRVEWQTAAPFPSIPLGRFGRSPGTMTLAPYVHAVYVARPASFQPEQRAGFYPSVGLGALTFFDLIRLDVARGLRDGRWVFSIDVARELWGIL